MSILPLGTSRVSNLMQSMTTAQTLDSTQSQLQQVEEELSTGLAVNQPSDNPSAAAMIMQLQQTLSWQQNYSDTINTTSGQLSQADSSLGTLTTLLQQAQQIASADVGSDVTESQRQSDATVVQSLYNQALAIGNQQYNGQYIFGGASGNSPPFVETDGTVQFVGSSQTLQNDIDDGISLTMQVNGANVFGSLSSGVNGTANISPALSAQTLISSVGGATGAGVQLGTIQISNGAVSKSVDLSSANSIGGVVNLINQAGVGGITASITGQGLTLTGAAGDNIAVTDNGGSTAEELGIATPSTGEGAGNPDVGGALNPQVTLLTPISALNDGAGIDNSGLTITNGDTTKTITWPAGGTVQDILNAINGAGLGVEAQINSAGTGINVLNSMQGTSLSIGENGGQTAADLGLQTMSSTTPLSQLNNGSGVQTAGGTTADFQITTGSGSTFQVALGSDQTVQDVLNSINTASGGTVTASMATTGSGIVLTDHTGGSGTFSLTPLNDSQAASQLGLTAAASGNTIAGTDTGAPSSNGIFGNLQALMTALESGNQTAITAAGGGITNDTNRVIELRGQTGAVEQELTSRQTQITEQTTATQSLVSQLQDVNYTQAVTQFQTLQTAMQADMETAASSLQLTLADFLD